MARSRRRYSRMMNKRRTARRTNTRRKMRGGGEKEIKERIIETLNDPEFGVIEKDVYDMSKDDILKVLRTMKDEIDIKSRKLAEAILIAGQLPDVAPLKKSPTRYFKFKFK